MAAAAAGDIFNMKGLSTKYVSLSSTICAGLHEI